MADTLVYLGAAGATVTCTVSLGGGAAATPTVTESSGVYTAPYAGTAAGILYVWWQDTTNSVEERQYFYYDGSVIRYLPTAQYIRDAMKLAHTDGDASIDVVLQNIETGSL